MKSIINLVIFYVVIVVFQIVFTYYNVNYIKNETQLDDKIRFNVKHYEDIKLFLKRELERRAELLISGKMNYDEWIKYNNDNVFVEYKGEKYDIFIYLRGENNGHPGDTIQLVCDLDKAYVGLILTDLMKDVGEQFVFLKQTSDPNLAKHFMELGRNGVTSVKYFWPDPVELKPTKKESQIITIPANKEHGELLMGIGLDLVNLDQSTRFYYINELHKSYLVLISLLTLFIAIIVYLFSKSNGHKSFIFLFLTNLYLLYYMNNSEYHGSTETEIKKIDQINSGILSVSFLVGVNTFIITSLTKLSDNELFIQSAIVFAISVILLLFSAFKITNQITISDLLNDRISNELIFNFSILLNIFVVSNYILSIIRTDPRVVGKIKI